MLLTAIMAIVLTAPQLASAATVTGTITDSATGQPIAGAEVIADRLFEPVAKATTDGSGNYELSLSPDKYTLAAFAEGYFIQGIGAEPGENVGPEYEIGALGMTGMNTAMVSEAAPYFWLEPPTMKWSHEARGGFRSMVLEISYGGSADLPEGWPGSADNMVVKIVDAEGRSVQPVRTGGQAWSFGSADGCSWFNSVKHPPDINRLRVIGYLQANPGYTKEAPIVPDYTGCKLSRLGVSRPVQINERKVFVQAALLDRLPFGTKVPGTVLISFNHGKPIRRHAADIAGGEYGEYVSSSALHHGRNTLRVRFRPRRGTVKAPPAKTIKFWLRTQSRRHRH